MTDFDFKVGRYYKSKRATYRLEGSYYGKSEIPYLVFVSTKSKAERLVRTDRLETDKFIQTLSPLLETYNETNECPTPGTNCNLSEQ